ncbi:MAG: YdiU family protein [Burkholderiaceae bacterium]|nr:YdiU family protein [Burkholderiaceae bacterium]
MPRFGLEHSYARELPGCSVPCRPVPVAAPRLLYVNAPLAEELGLDPGPWQGEVGDALFAGNRLPDDAEPIAQAYAGHQFGGFSPQLGDGRALLLGERIDGAGRRRDIAFKGSGRTPFSRGGDGRAALGPMLREVLIGEALHALGIPTTRALAVAATGEEVWRDRPLPGAVLTRVAASHLRVGTFQFFAARGAVEPLRRLVDYAIARHDPALAAAPDRALALLRAVAQRQAELLAQWLSVGFIHGVMNTDNMTISGESIDFGPCAFLEAYDPATVFSSIDHGGRYAYGNQAAIARWNLARFAEALLPLALPPGAAEEGPEQEAALRQAAERAGVVIDAFPAWHAAALRRRWRAKLGLDGASGRDDAALDAADDALLRDWLALLQAQAVDFTRAWRHLADAAEGREAPLAALFAEPAALSPWLARWRARCEQDDVASGRLDPAAAARERAARLRAVNPWIIARNQRVEEALAAATDAGDLGPFAQLLQALREPFTERPDRPDLARLAEPAPTAFTAAYRTFCGT